MKKQDSKGARTTKADRRNQLIKEATKLDPREEKALAEEGL
jgi:hypothetical protein